MRPRAILSGVADSSNSAQTCFVKSKTETKALDKAVEALAKATEKSWSSHTARQQAEKLQDLKRLMDSFSHKKHSAPGSNQSV